MDSATKVRRYQRKDLIGKNRICCWGYCLCGPSSDICPNLCVWLSILIPVTAFFVFASTHLASKAPLVLVVVGVSSFWTITSLCITSFSDPGIIPRQSKEQALAEALRSFEEDKTEDSGEAHGEPCMDSLPLSIFKSIDGNRVRCRLCTTCNVYKPPRTTHCSECDNCCKELDHHCPFVGNCVGQRNYGAFCAFLGSVVVLILTVAVSFFMSTADLKGSSTATIVVMICVIVFSLVMFFVIGGFSLFHCSLVCSGQTTKERLKGKQVDAPATRTLQCCMKPREFFPREVIQDDIMSILTEQRASHDESSF